MSDSKLAIILMAALCALLLFFDKADAGTITHDTQGTLTYEGTVSLGDADRIEVTIRNNDIHTVVLKSEGGAAMEGYKIGYVLRNSGVTARVDGHCLSACATAFMGAETKEIPEGSIIGFHNMWVQETMDTNEALKMGQIFGAIEAQYMVDMGYSSQLQMIVAYTTDPGTFFVFGSVEDFNTFKRDFLDFVDLPEGYVGEHIAGPTRLHLLMEGI